jgi:hypothetical protein
MLRSINALFLLVGTAAFGQTIGLMQYGPADQDGYVLFTPMSSNTTYLIDKCGRSIHTWPSNYQSGCTVYLLDDGSILRAGVDPNASFGGGGHGGVFQRIAWDGTLEWSYMVSDSMQCGHHDALPMPNGHVLVIAWEKHTAAEAVALGRDPATLGPFIWSEEVLELAPVGTSDATVVWEWHLWDHLVQDVNANAPGYGMIADHPEKVNINFVGGTGQVDWIHANAIDYNEDLDEIVLSAHNPSEIWVIDHSTTTLEASQHTGGARGHGGDLLYRWGNPQAYGRGGAMDQRFFGQHNVQWVRPGLPRAGDIMVFNNGFGRPGPAYSSVDIIAPPMDPGGNYTIADQAPYGPASEEFTWTATPPTSFYAVNISSAQVLPDGGLMMCNGPAGTFVEVDADGNEVWRYVDPVNSDGPMTQGETPGGNLAFRCTWIPPDHPGLSGRDLTPGDPIELDPVPNACVTAGITGPLARGKEISIAPLPASGRLWVRGLHPASRIELFDLFGKRIGAWTATQGTMELDLLSVPDGTYVLRISNEGAMTSRIVPVVH